MLWTDAITYQTILQRDLATNFKRFYKRKLKLHIDMEKKRKHEEPNLELSKRWADGKVVCVLILEKIESSRR